jgi:hypothetical protein
MPPIHHSRRVTNKITAAVIETLEKRTLLSFSLSPVTPFPTGHAPEGLATADFNRDGAIDVATVTGGANINSVSVIFGNNDGTFSAPHLVPTGVGPVDVTTADLRNNGIFDLITANTSSNTVSVMLGNGDGSFHAPTLLTAFGGPTSVIATDLNGDGIPDIVATNYNSEFLTVFFGNGDGTFQQPQFVNINTGASTSIQAADLNGDGKTDLIVATVGLNEITVLLGNGDGTFQTPEVLNTPASPTTVGSIAVADFNGDGIPDLAVGNSGSASLGIFLGNGDGTFGAEKLISIPNDAVSIAASDLNGDGKLDLIASQELNGSLAILAGNGDGTFAAPQIVPDGAFPISIAAVDVNKDGKPDLLTADFIGGDVGVQLNTQSGGQFFFPSKIIPVGGKPADVVSGDLNGDGISDFVIADQATNQVAVILGGGGSGIIPQFYPVANDPTAVTIADVNGDGHPDIIVACAGSNTIDVLLGNGDGTFQPANPIINDITISPGPNSITTGIPNKQDGTVDIYVAAGSDGFFALLPGTGDGTFDSNVIVFSLPDGGDAYAIATADFVGDGELDLVGLDSTDKTAVVDLYSANTLTTFYLGATPTGLVTGDFRGDGNADIAVATSAGIEFIAGNGGGDFAPRQTLAPNSHPFAIAAGDLTGSGTPDLIVSSPGGNSITALLPTGTGSFNPPITFVDPSFHFGTLAIGDANGDGKPDLVATSTIDNTLTAFKNNFQGGFFLSAPENIPTPNFPVTLASGIFRTGGKTDLVVGGVLDQDIQILLGNGDGTFASGQTFPISRSVTEVLVADVNGDGKLDIIAASGGYYDVAIYLGNGDGTFKAPIQADMGQAVGMGTHALAVADLNNDTHLDLIAAQTFSSQIAIALGNGDGTFKPATEINNPGFCAPNSVTIADLNGDGHPDIILTDGTADKIDLLLNNGDGSIGGFQSYNVGNYPTSAVVGDFNGDGKPDIAYTLNHANAVGFLFGSGNGLFTTGQNFVTVNSPYAITTADMSGDGHNDLIVIDTQTFAPGDSLAIIPGNGDGTFRSPIYFATANDPRAILAVDLNNDNGPDIVTADASSNEISVRLNTADNFAPAAGQITSGPSAAFTVGTGGTFAISTQGFSPGPAISISGTVPSGLTFHDNGNGTATLSGTPVQGTGSLYTLSILAHNGVNGDATQSFSLRINEAPSLQTTSATFAVNVKASFVIQTLGFPRPTPLTETGALPPGLTYHDNGDGSAIISGTPTGSAGDFPIMISANNGNNPPLVNAIFTIVIAAPVIMMSGNTVSVGGTAGMDMASVTSDGTNLTVNIDGMSQSYPLSANHPVAINLGDGNDNITIGAGVPPVNISGGAGNDIINAANSSGDFIGGGGGNDLITGGPNSVIKGGAGNDTVAVNGNSVANGGPGDDVFLDYGSSGDVINGNTGLNFAQNNPLDTLKNIFQVIDPVPTTPPAVAIPAAAPATNSVVTAIAAGGILDIEGTSTADNISVTSDGTSIHVTANGSSAGSFNIATNALTGILVNGKGGGDTINIDSSVLLTPTVFGGAGPDSITGGGGSNVLSGGAGSDTLVGGAGTNVLYPGLLQTFAASTAGRDLLIGGSGFTIADFSYRTDGMFLSNNGQNNSGDANFAEHITIMPSVNAIWGGSGADTIVGTVPGEFLSGGNGPDSITGGGADDLIVGGLGKDNVHVAAEPVTLYLRDGKRDHYTGVNNVDEDILQLDSKDRTP